ncbi:MAG: DUF4097 domain-containing protein [Lachnospiraceae bacterium]|nr:DUF4097 domain-containing protein [Lachnospiraceae bacterium]
MADEKKFSGWKRRYIAFLNAVTVVCIIVGCFIHIGGFIGADIYRSIWHSDTRTIRSDEGSGSNYAAQQFQSIDGDVSMGSVVLTQGDSYSCTYEKYPDNALPSIEIEDGELKITQKAKNARTFGDMSFKGSYNDAKIIITVPEDAVVDTKLRLNMGAFEAENCTTGELNIEADMGSIEVSDCKVKDLDLRAHMGGITVEDTTFDSGEFKADMGGITVNDCTFDNGEFKADMGGIDVEATFNKMEAKCSMGGISVEASNDDAKMNLSADVGGISVNGKDRGRKYKN